MTRRSVHVHRKLAASADAVWAIVREFSGKWHPLVSTIEVETSAGVYIRRFTMEGDDTTYYEKLVYFSDADRMLSYQHMQGIAGATHYEATLAIQSLPTGCNIEWSADIDADEPRATQIAKGTSAVFGVGIDALEKLTSPRTETVTVMGNGPAIAVDCIEGQHDILCLFLHGIGGGRNNWTAQLPVAAQFTQASAIDLRGYGESALGNLPSSIEDYCEDILRVMQHFKAKKIVLCGLSYGAWIATSFAMRHPENLAGLILAGGCTGMSEAPPEERERFRISREVPLDEGKSPKDFAQAVVNVIVSQNASADMRQKLFSSMAAIPAATYRDALRCFTQPKELFDFSRLTMPVLLLTGEHDSLASPAEIRSIAQRVRHISKSPNVSFEIISGAGHVCNVEAPVAFNALLKSFLAGLAT